MASDVQWQIRQNLTEHQAELQSLNTWSKEMAMKNSHPTTTTNNTPPPKVVPLHKSPAPVNHSHGKSNKISAYDYQAWDKYDVEAALNDSTPNPATLNTGDTGVSNLPKNHNPHTNLPPSSSNPSDSCVSNEDLCLAAKLAVLIGTYCTQS